MPATRAFFSPKARERSGKTVANFEAEVKRYAPENADKVRAVYGWLVLMYEQGYDDAVDDSKGK